MHAVQLNTNNFLTDRTLTNITSLGQSGPGSNDVLLHIEQNDQYELNEAFEK